MMKDQPICVICHDYAMPNSLYCCWCYRDIEKLRKKHAYDVLQSLIPALDQAEKDVTKEQFKAMCGGEEL